MKECQYTNNDNVLSSKKRDYADFQLIKEAYDFGSQTASQKALELTSLLEDNGSGAKQMILDLFAKIQR